MPSKKEIALARDLCAARISEIFDKSIDATNNTQQRPIFEVAYRGLQALYEEFKALHTQVAAQISSEDEVQVAEALRKRIDNNFLLTIINYEAMFPPAQIPTPNTSGSLGSVGNQSSTSSKSVKLPKISLRKFDGNISEWQSFIDLYNSLIHDQSNLPDIEKFQYLSLSLEKEPLQVIKTIPFAANNYQLAYDTLLSRYANERVQSTHHLHLLKNFKPLSIENAKDLRRLINIFEENLAVLRILKHNVDEWDFMIVDLLLDKLDPTTRKRFELEHSSSTIPTYKKLIDFVKDHCQALETLAPSNHSVQASSNSNFKSSNFKKFSHFSSNQTCNFCHGDMHLPFYCEAFMKLTPKERLSTARDLRLCINCLAANHSVKECKSKHSCKSCSSRHHTLLHFNQESSSKPNIQTKQNTVHSNHSNNSTSIKTDIPQAPTNSLGSLNTNSTTQVLLSTALIDIKGTDGKLHQFRALLDSGSESNFVTERVCKALNLQTMRTELEVSGVGKNISKIHERVKIEVSSKTSRYKATLSCFVMPNITGSIPQHSILPSEVNIPAGVTLADPTFHEAGQVDLLIGACIFYEILTTGQIKLGHCQPILQNTNLGWIVSGPISIQEATHRKSNCFFSSNSAVQEQLERFWSIEEFSPQVRMTQQEQECEKHFVENFSRDESGRFIVKLPVRDNYQKLGESKETAVRRFLAVERKLQNNPELHEDYVEFMNEYEALGHMSKIQHESDSTDGVLYYLPHHSVIKKSSTYYYENKSGI